MFKASTLHKKPRRGKKKFYCGVKTTKMIPQNF